MRVFPQAQKADRGAGPVGTNSPGQGSDPTSPSDVVRSLVARMTTPLLPDDYLRMVNPLWSARELRGKVVEVIPETADTATLVIKPGWGWSITYQPGQYVGIGVHIDGQWHWRSYSVSSTPERSSRNHRERQLTITVKAMPEGFLSEHLVRGLDAGTIVRLALPQGEFVLPDPPPPKVLFWTGGSGITPVMSMLRTLHRRDAMPDVVHIHSSPTMDSAIFREERIALADRHPGLRMIENFDDRDGILDVGRLTEVCPDWMAREAWVCGPAPMLAAAETHWAAAAACQETAPGAFLRCPRHVGRRRTRHVRHLRQGSRCGRRHHLARSRRSGRDPDALRMPDGHLPHLHRPSAEGRGQRPAERHGISGERRRADLCHSCRW